MAKYTQRDYLPEDRDSLRFSRLLTNSYNKSKQPRVFVGDYYVYSIMGSAVIVPTTELDPNITLLGSLENIKRAKKTLEKLTEVKLELIK